MHNRFDQFVKNVLREMFDPLGTSQRELEISTDAQRPFPPALSPTTPPKPRPETAGRHPSARRRCSHAWRSRRASWSTTGTRRTSTLSVTVFANSSPGITSASTRVRAPPAHRARIPLIHRRRLQPTHRPRVPPTYRPLNRPLPRPGHRPSRLGKQPGTDMHPTPLQ